MLIKYLFWLFMLAYWHCCLCDVPCQSFIDGLQSKYPNFEPHTLTPQEKYYVDFSGRRGPRDLGQRKLCEDQPSMRYYVLILPIDDFANSNNQNETGICVINECNKEILRSNDAMVKTLFRLNNWNVGHKRTIVYDIYEGIPKRFAFYFSVILHIVLTLLVIISTVVIYIKSKRSSKVATGEAAAAEVESPPPKPKSDPNHWLFEAFNARENFNALFKVPGGESGLSAFSFLRVVASWWIVSFHINPFLAATSMYISPDNGFHDYRVILDFYGVECYFFMGGFLAIITLVPRVKGQKFTLLKLYQFMRKRLMRTWPLCMMTVIFLCLVLNYMFQGPLWRRYTIYASTNCDSSWWRKMFLIDNLAPDGRAECANWSWYVNVDIHSYLLVVINAFVYSRSRRVGYLMAWALVLQSTLTGIFYGRATDYRKFYTFSPSRWNEVFIGVLYGFQYYDYNRLKHNKNLFKFYENSPVLRYISMILGVALGIFDVYIKEKFVDALDWPVWGKILFCLAVALVFAPIIVSKDSLICRAFSLRVWQILGKLGYGLYLFHIPVAYAMRYSMNHITEEYTSGLLAATVIKTIIITYCVAFIYWMLVENPMVNIDIHISKTKPKVPKETAKDEKPKNNRCKYFISTPINIISSKNFTQIMLSPGEQTDYLLFFQYEHNNITIASMVIHRFVPQSKDINLYINYT